MIQTKVYDLFQTKRLCSLVSNGGEKDYEPDFIYSYNLIDTINGEKNYELVEQHIKEMLRMEDGDIVLKFLKDFRDKIFTVLWEWDNKHTNIGKCGRITIIYDLMKDRDTKEKADKE